MQIKKPLKIFLLFGFVMCDFCQLNCEKSCLLSAKDINKMVNSNSKNDREQIAACSELTFEQIKTLYNDLEYTVKTMVSSYLQDADLSKEQIDRIFDTGDQSIINLVVERFYNKKGNIQSVVCDNETLKIKLLNERI